jgi:hypothetical protein
MDRAFVQPLEPSVVAMNKSLALMSKQKRLRNGKDRRPDAGMSISCN